MNSRRTSKQRFLINILAGVAGLGLAGCQTINSFTPSAGTPPPAPPVAAQQQAPAAPARVAILLPLSGQHEPLGRSLLAAAKLALETPNAPKLDVYDTAGSREGAIQAARRAVAAGDKLMIGPLTARETAAVAPITQMAHLPVLAFTNDPKQGRIGVWTLGITPAQQVHRLLQTALTHGESRLAAVLPENAFGDTLARAYLHMPPGGKAPIVRRYADQNGAVQALRSLAANGQVQCDTLLLAESGQRLQALLPTLADLHLTPPQVRLMGPDLWAQADGSKPGLAGAWYAAPDPSLRQNFAQQYGAHYGTDAPHLADLAYDAASLARVLSNDGDYSLKSLERPSGFAGVDGVFVLSPDGHVFRGLAVFELGQAGPRIVEASPTDLSGDAP